MDRVSRKQVEAVKNDLKAEIDLLPTASELKESYDKISETVLFLRECWNTAGGAKELQRLFSLFDELSSVEYIRSIGLVNSSYNNINIYEWNCSKRIK